MSAAADIIINERNNVLLVPNRAIKRDTQGKPMVEVMIGDQMVEKPVSLGISDGTQTEILSGLNEGDMVILEKKTKTGTDGLFFGGQ